MIQIDNSKNVSDVCFRCYTSNIFRPLPSTKFKDKLFDSKNILNIFLKFRIFTRKIEIFPTGLFF